MRKLYFMFFLIFLFIPLTGYPEKLTVVYTGNTCSTLYPCGHCPASVGGGVARRAAVLKEILTEVKNPIIVDSGNFTAGTQFDEASINPKVDKIRTLFYLQTMNKMGYDFAGLGEGELIFGKDFLSENIINKCSFKIVSANIDMEGIKPYYIKDFNGLKVAVIGLSPDTIYKKYGITIVNYETALQNTIKELENKADFLILLSALGDLENLKLAGEFPQIKLIVSSGDTVSTAAYETAGETLILRPAARGREIRYLELDVLNGKILSKQFKKKELPISAAEDVNIKKMIPVCFQDSDCSKKEGLVSKCDKAGNISALCAYYEAKKIDAVLITDKQCKLCSTEFTEKFLSERFLGIQFQRLHYQSKEAQDLIKKYKINSLPCFILPAEVKEENKFAELKGAFHEEDKKIILNRELSGMFFYLNREEISRRIDLFLDFYAKDSARIFEDLVKFSSENKIVFNVYFILPKQTEYGYPKEEVTAALAVRQVHPDKFIDYLRCRLKDIKNNSWIKSLEEIGGDYLKIKEIADSSSESGILQENEKLIAELGIGDGNVIFVNNNRIFKVFRINVELLKELFN